MKTRFSTLDIKAIVKELQRFLGMRVANVYDIDSRTYMIRVAKPDQKSVILIESGNRLHSTEFDWPKNPAPSGFSMKLRKHLRGRRLEVIQQFGIDRVVDLQFGSGEAAYHLVVELYDRGNLVLTDSEYTILNILRPRTDDSQDVRFAVRETYPIHTTKQFETISQERIKNLLHSAKEGDNLKRVLMPNLEFGPALLEHCLREAGLTDGGKIGKTFNIDTDFNTLYSALLQGETILKNLNSSQSKGYIIQKSEKRPSAADGESPVLLSYDEFHPFLFKQHADRPYVEFELFDKAVDEYFSKLEGQKLDLKALQQEKSALKKLDNVRRDHEKRVGDLRKEQEVDFLKGQLVEMNLELVDRAILVVRSALANQIDWAEINELVKEAQGQDDPVAAAIKSLRLDLNSISLLLRDPYTGEDLDEEDLIQPMKVDIDLGLSAYANSRKYFEKKKKAVVKEQKTVDSSTKAFKSAEKKTQQTLKDMATAVSINKTRKTYWFEKFLWFISSENFLVIGGRDQQQNELIVKRYLRPGDVYVHADLHGASSVIIKNTTGLPVPPKTLNEAGTMAICNSAAWDAKVVTSAWWVNPEQVSKTAPSGEYLTTGSFMIRGKKNYLPPSYLVYGFGFLFKLEDGSISRHHGERRVRTVDGDDTDSVAGSVATETEVAVDDLSDGEGEETAGDPDNPGEATTATDGGSTACEGTEGNSDSLTSVKTDTYGGQAGDGQSTVAVGGDSGGCEDREVKTEAADEASAEGGEDHSDNAFPDTSISLHHVQGDRFTLQPQLSQTDSVEDGESALSEKAEIKKQGAKLSAKQRRELKKGRKGGAPHTLEEDQQTDTGQKEERTSVCEEIGEDSTKTSSKPPPQAQPKRGRKGKQKKIRDKYGDQDEEERQLRMEILASAGAQKEVKNKKKKKGKAPVEKVQVHNVQQQQDVRKHLQSLAAVDGAPLEGTNESVKSGKTKPATTQEDEDSGSEDEKGDKDERPVVEDSQILDSLTGRPVPDDELLFAIPVCAPYQAINTYKFKVKLLPGSSKKGKATKTALGIFLHDRETRAREKDLIRIMKDVDLSRNIPGKVKVLAPNLTKQRKK